MDYRLSHIATGKGKSYDESFAHSDYRLFVLKWEKQTLQKIINEYVHNKENYLDFACGTGRITEMTEHHFTNSFGVDISETMLKEAERRLKTTKIFAQDLTKNNPFKENQMDFITSFRFFLNAEAKLRTDVLKQLYSILQPNGYLVFNIHNNRTLISQIIDRLAIAKKKYHNIKFTPQKSFSIQETKHLLMENHFEIVKTYHRIVLPIKSENTKLKFSKYYKIEDFFSNIPFAKHFSRNIIYVCKKV